MQDFAFTADIIYWRGPAPFYFATIPTDVADEIAAMAKFVSYGWGVIPVRAEILGVPFSTSLFPRNDTYLLPLKLAVRRQIGMPEQGSVAVTMHLGRSD